MTEQDIKGICKWLVQNSNRQLTILEKEAIKKAIDDSESLSDLLGTALMVYHIVGFQIGENIV